MQHRLHDTERHNPAVTPGWRRLRWAVAVPALLMAGLAASAGQNLPAPAIQTAGGLPPLQPATQMNLFPVAFRQPAPMADKGKPADKPADKPGELPPPKSDGGPLADKPRLSRMGDGVFGATPNPSAEELKEYGRFVDRLIDPRNTVDVVESRTRLMMLKVTPTKIQVADERVATVETLEPRQLSLQGLRVGTTVLNLFFEDPKDKTQKILSYLVRVIPDAEEKLRLERAYQALEKEINSLFCDSHVKLSLVGDKIAVAGQAKDVYEGTQILRIVRANAPGRAPQTIPVNSINLEVRPDPNNPNHTLPGLSDFLLAGGPNIINLLRIPGEQQVMLKVIVAEVNRSAARSIGLNFNITNNNGVTVFSQRTGNIAAGGNGAVAAAGGGVGTGAGIGGLGLLGLVTNNLPVNLDGGQIPLAINALRELSYARSLAEPNLVAINGQQANFQAGGQFPVPITSGIGAGGFGGGGGGVLQGVNFVPFGVQLSFTPFIVDRDRIRLQVQASVSTRDLATGANIGGAGVPGLNTRNFNTTVELREGQTLAVAGLIQNNLGSQADRVPGIGDLPILNRVFGYDRIQSAEQELVVLITPELVHPLDKKELPPLPGSDLLEPSDLEFYVCGRLESQKGRDYRASVRNTIGRMKAYHAMEGVYVHGPAGLTDSLPAPLSAIPSAIGPSAPAPASPPPPPMPPVLTQPAPVIVPPVAAPTPPAPRPLPTPTPLPAQTTPTPRALPTPLPTFSAPRAAPPAPPALPDPAGAVTPAAFPVPRPDRMPQPYRMPAQTPPSQPTGGVVRPYALPSPYAQPN